MECITADVIWAVTEPLGWALIVWAVAWAIVKVHEAEINGGE